MFLTDFLNSLNMVLLRRSRMADTVFLREEEHTLMANFLLKS